MLLKLDRLISSVTNAKKRSKYRKNKVLQSLRQRIENFQRDMHYQAANFLTSKYDNIILPVFGSKGMSSKLDRRLRTKTVRSMLGLGHYAFRMRLKEVAERRGAKTFKCQECSANIDRDLLGIFKVH